MCFRVRARDPRFQDEMIWECDSYDEADTIARAIRKYAVYLEDVTPPLCEVEHRVGESWHVIKPTGPQTLGEIGAEMRRRRASRWN